MNTRTIVVTALILVTSLVVRSTVLHAENTIELRVNAGDTIEIGTDSRAVKPEFSWILTKDRKFQNAQRSRFFQTRFAQAGTYILDVSIQDPTGSGNDYRAFTIIVADQPTSSLPPNPANLDGIPLQAILKSTSPTVDGKIYVPTEGGLIKIDPSESRGKISSYDIDIDSTIDSNGDGDPTNDRDTADSLSSKTGSPIYLYISPKGERRSITLTVSSLTNPVPGTTSLEIAYGTAPIVGNAGGSSSASATIIQMPGSPITLEKNKGTVHFEANIQNPNFAGKELLYSWDFGDRTQSLLTSPTHIYTADGTYTITLTVRDIATGTTVHTEVTSVTIDGSATLSFSSNSSSVTTSVSSMSSSTQSTTGSSGSAGAILWVGAIIFFIFLLFVALVGIIIFIKSRFTGRIQDTLEKMEKSIVQKDAKQAILETRNEPMKLKKDDTQKESGKDVIIEKEKSTPEMRSASVRTNETPVSSSGPVPSWLTNSQNSVSSTPPSVAPSQPVSTMKVAPVAEKPTTVQRPPEPAPKPASPVPAPAPSWLKPDTPTTAPSMQKPVSPPSSASGPVPAWLEKKPSATPVASPVTQVVTPSNAPVTAVGVEPTPPTVVPTQKPATPTPTATSQASETAPKVSEMGKVSPTPTPILKEKTTETIAESQQTPPVQGASVTVPTPVAEPPAKKEEVTPLPVITPQSTSVDATVVVSEEKKNSDVSEPLKSVASQASVDGPTIDDDEPVAFVQADSLTNDAQK